MMQSANARLRILTAFWLLRDLDRERTDPGVFNRMVDARSASIGSSARWREVIRDVANDAEIQAASPELHAKLVGSI